MARKKDGVVQLVNVDRIYTDDQLQSRVRNDLEVVREYADAMAAGDEFPAIVVFFDGAKYWLADGNHRLEACKHLKLPDIRATVFMGTKRDAILYSAGANATHGIRRSNDDKKKQVLKLLSDPEWCLWVDPTIAKFCNVSTTTVSRYRAVAVELPGHGIGTRINKKGQLVKVHSGSSTPSTAVEDEEAETVPPPRYRTPKVPLSKREVTELYLSRIARHLRVRDKAVQTYVPTELGVIDLATTSTVYSFVSTGTPEELDRFIGRMILLRQCHNPGARIVFIGYFTPAHEPKIRWARAAGLEFLTPDEILAD